MAIYKQIYQRLSPVTKSIVVIGLALVVIAALIWWFGFLRNDLFHTLIFVIIILWLLFLPIARYLEVGWVVKKQEIFDKFDDNAKTLYLKYFSNKIIDPQEAASEFETLYQKRYGRRHFFWPLVLLLIISFYEAVLVGHTIYNLVQNRLADTNIPWTLPKLALAALAGAYMWVVSDFISRSRRLDFAPANILWSALRFVISIALGYSFSGVLEDKLGFFIAFAMGAFPLNTIFAALRQLGNNYLKLELGPANTRDQVVKLNGVDAAIGERLADEDITTIPQLAYYDPIQLTMRSNLSFAFVLDIVNQALAWLYLEDKLNKIRPIGLRGAFEIRILVESIDYSDSRAWAAFQAAALACESSEPGLEYCFRQLKDDPFVEFIYTYWVDTGQ
jgi:hypothetical protein